MDNRQIEDKVITFVRDLEPRIIAVFSWYREKRGALKERNIKCFFGRHISMEVFNGNYFCDRYCNDCCAHWMKDAEIGGRWHR